jgi:hypothetical protein
VQLIDRSRSDRLLVSAERDEALRQRHDLADAVRHLFQQRIGLNSSGEDDDR